MKMDEEIRKIYITLLGEGQWRPTLKKVSSKLYYVCFSNLSKEYDTESAVLRD